MTFVRSQLLYFCPIPHRHVQAARVMSTAAAAIFVACITFAAPAFATKPCPPPPCAARAGSVDGAKCAALAAWVAVGGISKIVHHHEGPPLSKDFAEFTFTVTSWEKGSGTPGQQIRFQVGWCENGRPLPEDTAGSFRFFGEALPADVSFAGRYLDFEAVQPARP
jgi:hypothetical protein